MTETCDTSNSLAADYRRLPTSMDNHCCEQIAFLREDLRNARETKDNKSRLQQLNHLHSTSLDLLALYVDTNVMLIDNSSKVADSLLDLSSLRGLTDSISKNICDMLAPTGISLHLEDSRKTLDAQPRCISKRSIAILQKLLWKKILRTEKARICFFGASITQQKESVSYISMVEKASTYCDSIGPIRISAIKQGYGGMHVTDAGIYYLGAAINSDPDICILEWHSTALSEWPAGLLEKICYTLLACRIIPIVLIIPRSLPEYFEGKSSTSRYTATKRLADLMGISIIDLSQSLTKDLVAKLTRDGIHTNEFGAVFYGCRIYRQLLCISKSVSAVVHGDERRYTDSQVVLQKYHSIDLLASQKCQIGLALDAGQSIEFLGPTYAECVLNVRVGPFSPRVAIADSLGSRKLSLFDPWCHFERDTLRVRFCLGATGKALISVLREHPDYSICRDQSFSPPDKVRLVVHEVLYYTNQESNFLSSIDFRILCEAIEGE